MIFSKSFGYALRGILYVAAKSETHPIQVDELSEALGVPKHFLAKIMNKLAQKQILVSLKGPYGGFSLHQSTLHRPLIDLYRVTDNPEHLNQCVLSRGSCNPERPCRLHDKVLPLKAPLHQLLYETTIKDLLEGDVQELMDSLTVTPDFAFR